MHSDIIYDSSSRRNPALEELLNTFSYRDLIFQIMRRDITTRYKRSVLGIAWTMLNPLGIMIIMTVVFSSIFHRQEFFSVYLLSGLLIWNFFAQSSNAVIHNLIWGGDLFQRIYIPRATFAVAAIGTGAINLVLALVPLLLVKLVLGSPISWHIAFFPLYVVMCAAFALGVGLLIASLAIYFHDFAEMYQVLLTGWFYLTPIIYPLDLVPERVRQFLYLNPMVHLVELMRDSFYLNRLPDPGTLAVAAGVSVLALIIGWLVFARQTEEFVLRA